MPWPTIGLRGRHRQGRVKPQMEDTVEAYNRGMEYLDYNEPDQAIAAFSAALDRNPRFAHAYFARGYAYAGQGDAARAVADFSAAIRYDPTLVGAYHNRANAYHLLGDELKAQADLAKCAQLRSGRE